ICRSHLAFADPGSCGSDRWLGSRVGVGVGVGVAVAVKVVVTLFLSHCHQHRMGWACCCLCHHYDLLFTEPLAKQSTISLLHLSFSHPLLE
ncbi:unnamed protein product, partial [Musa acuminata var. zebrina]